MHSYTPSGPLFTLWMVAVTLVFVGLALYRRTRAQPVKPRQAIVVASVVALLSGLGLVGTGQAAEQPLELALAPVALALGLGLGLVLMRSIRFWRDERSGALWMRGGVVYVVVWLAVLALRFGVRYTATGTLFASAGTGTPPALHAGWAVLSTDLLFLSVGLWIARAVGLVQRYNAHDRMGSTGSTGSMGSMGNLQPAR